LLKSSDTIYFLIKINTHILHLADVIKVKTNCVTHLSEQFTVIEHTLLNVLVMGGTAIVKEKHVLGTFTTKVGRKMTLCAFYLE